METVLCSVPTESPGADLRLKRSEGTVGMNPKIAIYQLNHWAEKNGFPACKFYDLDMLYPPECDIEKYFRENKADVVGLSAVVSTSYLQVKKLTQIIKKVNQKTLVVCGGYLTAAANTILKKTGVDICVVGDGEIAWVSILKYMKEHLKTERNKLNINKLLEVKGIAVLDDDKNLKFSGFGQPIASCHMVFPDFEYLRSGLLGNNDALQNYFRPFNKHHSFVVDSRSFEKGRKPMTVTMFSSKGCVSKCTFCQRGSKGYLTYDLSKLEKYIKNLRDNYNVGFIHVDDENFGSNKKYAYQMAELLNKYNMLWSAAGVRCTSINETDIIHYKKNGCVQLKFGIETGSQTMLDIMEKRFKVEDIKNALFVCYKHGLFSPPAGFMIGMPGENLKTIKESGKLLGEIAAKMGVSPELIYTNVDISYALPLCGTPLYEHGKQLGLIGQNETEEEKFLGQTSNSGTHKRYYINLNGSPMSEVVFWDMLVYLESARTYAKLMKGKTENEEMKKKFISVLEVHKLNPHAFAKQKSIKILGVFTFSKYFMTNFLRKHIVFNKIVARLPSFIVDPIVRYMIYFEFLIQKHLFKDSHNLHTNSNNKYNPKIRIKNDDVDPSKTTQKDRSLRSIVAKKMMKLNRTEQEKTLSMLTGGP